MQSAEKRRGGRSSTGMVDVAKLAGVSAQTVSRVLSGHPSVREETRTRVLDAVEQLGYRRSAAARILHLGRSNTVGLVMLRTNFYSRSALNVGIEAAAQARGFSVRAVTVPSLDTTEIELALSRLVEQGVDGIILAVPLIDTSPGIHALTRAVPTVTVDGSRTDSTEVVAIDQDLAASIATRHLLDLGHETVWHLAGPPLWLEAESRSSGWRAALEAAGRTVPPQLYGDWSAESGYQQGLVFARMTEATAIFVDSDEMAFGVIRALLELGRDVPGQVSVVSVDDIELAQYCTPPLTTVAQPFARMGELAVAHLLRHIEDRELPHEMANVAPQLIVRSSTAPPPR